MPRSMCKIRCMWFRAVSAGATPAQVDVAVVETGLGGVRDATNVFAPKTLKLAVITAIGLEHQKALGGSLAEIAAAKAGMPWVPSALAWPSV